MKWIVIALTLFLSACGNKRLPTVGEYYTQVQGSWISPCFDLGGNYRQQQLIFNQNHVDFKEIVFEDSSCSAPVYELKTSASYSFGNYADQILERSIVIIYYMDKTYLTPLSNGAATELNAESQCGINTWQSGSSQEVSGLSCADNEKPIPQTGKSYLNLIKIQDGYFYQGDDRCEVNNTCKNISGQAYPTQYYPYTLTKQ